MERKEQMRNYGNVALIINKGVVYFVYPLLLLFCNFLRNIKMIDTVNLGINIFVILVIGFFHFCFMSGKGNKDEYIALAQLAGVFGTFSGIVYGLYFFDGNVDGLAESLPSFLHGIKTAFLTSLVGMGASISMKWLGASEETKSVDQNFNELREAINITNIKIESLIGSVKENNKSTQIIGGIFEHQLSKNTKALDSFAEKITENSTQAIVEALNTLVSNFNQNLTTQFGENFKELNEAVKDLVVWQENYHDIVDQAYIKLIESSVTFEQLNKHMILFKTSTREMNGGIEIFNDSATRMNNVTLELAKKIESLTVIGENAKTFTSDIEGFRKSYEEFIRQLNDKSPKMEENFLRYYENFNNSLNQFNEKSKNYLEFYGKSITSQVKSLETSLKMSTGIVYENLADSSKELSESLKEQLKNSIETFAEHTTNLIGDIYFQVNNINKE